MATIKQEKFPRGWKKGDPPPIATFVSEDPGEAKKRATRGRLAALDPDTITPADLLGIVADLLRFLALAKKGPD